MLRGGDDSPERERFSFGPESILTRNSQRVAYALLSFYLLCIKTAEKSMQSHHYMTEKSGKMWNFLSIVWFSFFKRKLLFLAVQVLWGIRLTVSLMFLLLP